MMRVIKIACVLVCMVGPAISGKATSSRQGHRAWAVYSGDLAGSKYSSLDAINRDNVSKLEPAWVFECGNLGRTIECNPIVVEGRMYVTSPNLRLIALDAKTGKRIWSYNPFDSTGGHGVNRGVSYWESSDGRDQRLLYVAGNYLYAIDAGSGEPIESFGENGRVDLREGLDRDAFFLSVTTTTPGVVYQDLLILGSSVGEGPSLSAPGHIRAFNVRTGEREWIFHTIPYPGEFGYETWPEDAWKVVGGANAWGGFTLDPSRGLVFCGTGSPAYDHYGGNRKGKNLFGNCILALDAATGERRWHFQVVHHDLWDYDIPCPPNLVTVHRNGKEVDAVAQPTKMGHLFVLNRETGKPIFPVEERRVPQSKLPGEETWPTQPFPTKPPAYARQRFTREEVTRLNPKARDAILDRLEKMRTGEIFLPPGRKPSVVLPQFNGGTNWGGAAYDPKTGILYVNTSNEAEWISMEKTKPDREMTREELGRHLYTTVCSACHGGEEMQQAGLPTAPSLKHVDESLSKADVRKLLKNGRKQMPSFEHLSKTEIDSIIAFLYGEGTKKEVPTDELETISSKRMPYVATGHNEFRDPEGFPANRRPWGTLNAIDLTRGEILWQTPLGTYPALEEDGYPPTGTFNMGGPLVTAGGLVFIGAAMDERFHAYDKESGELLWEYQLEAGGYATPATYAIDGKQYVVIAAGGGGKPGTKRGDAYYAFSLPK